MSAKRTEGRRSLRAIPADQFIRDQEEQQERALMRWEKVEKGRRAAPARVSIHRTGVLRLNGEAFRLLGCPRAAEVLLEARRKLVGIRPVDPSTPGSYLVSPERRGGRGGGSIAAKPLVDVYMLPRGTYPTRLMAGMLVFELTEPRSKTHGPAK